MNSFDFNYGDISNALRYGFIEPKNEDVIEDWGRKVQNRIRCNNFIIHNLGGKS
jgi:hypothetical protein